MEFLISLAILAVAFFWLLNRSDKSKNSGSGQPPRSTPATRPQPWEPQRPKSPTRRTPPAFEAKGAKHVPAGRTVQGRAYIIDGDSLVIQKTQIRLFGVDAPELNHPYGQKAKWALHALCKGKTIRAEITEIDHHGRTVAKCLLPDGRDLSREMVKAGLAIDWPKFSGGKYKCHETDGLRKKLWLADARQKGRMHVWEQFEYDQMRRNRK